MANYKMKHWNYHRVYAIFEVNYKNISDGHLYPLLTQIATRYSITNPRGVLDLSF